MGAVSQEDGDEGQNRDRTRSTGSGKPGDESFRIDLMSSQLGWFISSVLCGPRSVLYIISMQLFSDMSAVPDRDGREETEKVR